MHESMLIKSVTRSGAKWHLDSFKTFACWTFLFGCLLEYGNIIELIQLTYNIWGDQAKWALTRAHHIFSFLLGVILHLKSYVLQKTQLKLDMSFAKLWPIERLSKQKKKDLFPLFGSISKSIFENSHSFCLITPHMDHNGCNLQDHFHNAVW